MAFFTDDGSMPLDIEQHLGEASTNGKIVGVEIVRPANTTAYSINDRISDSTSAPTTTPLVMIGRYVGRSGYIVKARVTTDLKTCTATLRLHLYHTATTPINDNEAQSLLYADKGKRIGYIDFPALSTEDATPSDCAESQWTGQMFFTLDVTTRDLYPVLETKSTFTPASGQKFYIELAVDNN